MHIVRPLTEQIEHLRKGQSHQKIVGAVRVRDDKESSCFPIAHAVKLQLVIAHDLPKLGDVKGCQPSAAGNKDRFCRLARNELSRTFYQKNKQQYYLLHYACCVCHLAV